MKHPAHKESRPAGLPVLPSVGFGIFVLAMLLIWAYAQIAELNKKVSYLKGELATTNAQLAKTSESLGEGLLSLEERASGLEGTLSSAQREIEDTKKSVGAVASQVGGVEGTLAQVSGTVGNLEKLSKTDPELLQKYSKVFFLNEHYSPERLSEIPSTYLYSERRPESLHALVWPRLQAMLDAAKFAGKSIYVKSAYRSFDTQAATKSTYVVTYGAGTANQFSADQGYSEHQLGTTVDLITTGLGGMLEGFDNTPEYSWLQNNAHRYGFTLSYPESNDYYIFEPWHWRFVGVELATYLHNNNLHFYDMEQRDIDEYLIKVFD